jgi:hypothetical protein
MDTSQMRVTRLRWLRALAAAFMAEVSLIVVAVPIYAALGNQAGPTLNAVVPTASFVIFIFAGWWAARPESRNAVLEGALTGIWAVVLYIGLGLVTSQFVKGTSVTDGFTTPYLIAHALKIIGGALGGWLVSRKAAAVQ